MDRAVSLQLPSAESVELLHAKFDTMAALLKEGGLKAAGKDSYIEPGPGSPRQYFTAGELIKRFGLSKTTIYEIPDFELPRLKKDGWIRFHWAHVWAYEGKISREQAEQLFNGGLSEGPQ